MLLHMASCENSARNVEMVNANGLGRGRQAVLYSPGKLEMREVELPKPKAGELLIEVKCALSCGTDLKTYKRGHPLFPTPTPLGHEFSGIVAQAGPGVDKFKIGDAIVAVPSAPCMTCFFCWRGQENLCRQVVEHIVMGAYADYLLLPAHVVARHTFKKPSDVSFEVAALLEPLSCVFHAQEMAQVQSFETVLILGAGPLGLLHLSALKARGARRVVVAGRRANRLRAAAEFGADDVIDVEREEVEAVACRLNSGFGPDVVIEATGQVAGWEQALRLVRRGGRVVFFGGCPSGTSVALDTRRMHYDNLTLLAPFHYRPRDVAAALAALQEHALPGVERIIDSRRRLAELAEVFALLERGELLKCAIVP